MIEGPDRHGHACRDPPCPGGLLRHTPEDRAGPKDRGELFFGNADFVQHVPAVGPGRLIDQVEGRSGGGPDPPLPRQLIVEVFRAHGDRGGGIEQIGTVDPVPAEVAEGEGLHVESPARRAVVGVPVEVSEDRFALVRHPGVLPVDDRGEGFPVLAHQNRVPAGRGLGDPGKFRGFGDGGGKLRKQAAAGGEIAADSLRGLVEARERPDAPPALIVVGIMLEAEPAPVG